MTTHSIEEAEALSTKMGIMVRGGHLRCYGSSWHIKNKYSQGYELEMKIRKTTFEELQFFKTTYFNIKGDLASKVNLYSALCELELMEEKEPLLKEIIR